MLVVPTVVESSSALACALLRARMLSASPMVCLPIAFTFARLIPAMASVRLKTSSAFPLIAMPPPAIDRMVETAVLAVSFCTVTVFAVTLPLLVEAAPAACS